MKYLLLIHQGDTPTPRDPEAWAKLSEEEQKAVYSDYQAINQTPGVTSGLALGPPETATTVRVEDGRTLTTDGPFVAIKEALGGYLVFEADDLDAAIELAGRIPSRPARRCHRGTADRGVLAILEQAFREEWGRVLAALIGFLGDFELAEEAAQEAFAIAAERWPRDGTPANPRAWLVATARNRAIDRIRRDRTLATKLRLLDLPESMDPDVEDSTIPDERLELIFTCCHPALALDAQVALTLRTLGAHHRGDRARLPRAGAHDGEAPRARKAQDRHRGHPVSRAARAPAARPPGGRARGGLPDLQRGL